MPPKGDIVSDLEIELSYAISDIRIISKTSSLTVFNELPAREYSISAEIDEITFTMQLLVIEQYNCHPYIETMQIEILGGRKCELEPLIQQVIDSKEPTMLLLGLRSYINEVKYRNDVWEWMKSTWESFVSFPASRYSNYVLVCTDTVATPSDKPKCIISWSIKFSPEGIVRPMIRPFFQMQVDDPEGATEVTQLQKEMISVFGDLLDIRGVECAIRFLLSCIL